MFPRVIFVLLCLIGAAWAGHDQATFDADLRMAAALNNRALAFKQSGRLDSSLHYLHQASGILPLPEILNNIGNIESSLGRNESAKEYYTKALQADGENAYALYNLASLHWEGGNPGQAMVFFEQALCGEKANEIRSRLPSDVVFLQNLPRIRETAPVAMAPFNPVGPARICPPPMVQSRYEPRIPNSNDNRVAAVYTTPSNDTGNVLYSLGRYDEALFYYMQAQDEAPRCINAQLNAGLCHFKTGRFKECRNVLEEALFWQEIFVAKPLPSSCTAIMQSRFCGESQRPADFADAQNPNSFMTGDLSMAHYALATALYNTGFPERAEVEFRKALAISPEFSEALTGLGRILRRSGNFALAVEALVKSAQSTERPARPDLGFGGYCRINADPPARNEGLVLGSVGPVFPDGDAGSK